MTKNKTKEAVSPITVDAREVEMVLDDDAEAVLNPQGEPYWRIHSVKFKVPEAGNWRFRPFKPAEGLGVKIGNDPTKIEAINLPGVPQQDRFFEDYVDFTPPSVEQLPISGKVADAHDIVEFYTIVDVDPSNAGQFTVWAEGNLTRGGDVFGGGEPLWHWGAEISINRIEFVENPNQKYGFDDFSMTGGSKWKSVATNDTDVVDLEISPVELVGRIKLKKAVFNGGDAGLDAITPTTPNSAKETITLDARDEEYLGDHVTAHIDDTANAAVEDLRVLVLPSQTIDVKLVPINDGQLQVGNIDLAAIKAEMDRILSQAAISVDTLQVAPALEIDYDIAPANNSLDIANGNIPSAEQQAIYAQVAAGDPNFDFTILLVHDVKRVGPDNEIGGVAFQDRNLAFAQTNQPDMTEIAHTIVHEIGHLMGIGHINEGYDSNGNAWQVRDKANLMRGWPIKEKGRDKLRQPQWTAFNEGAADAQEEE